MAELPLVPRTCTLSCETARQREWRSVKNIFDEHRPCWNISFNHTGYLSTSVPFAVSPVPAVCQTLKSVHFLSSLPWVRRSWTERWNPHCPLAPEGNCKVTLRERGSVKDMECFWQIFINLSSKTEVPLPLYTVYVETDEWLTMTTTGREIPRLE